MKTLMAAILTCLTMFTVCVAQDKAKTDDHKSEAKAETYDLSIKFVKGQKTKYRMTQVQNQTITTGDKETKTVSTTVYTFSQETKDVAEDGNATITENYERIQLKKKQGDEVTVDFDSDEDEVDDLDAANQIVALLQGVDMSLTVTPKGKVDSFEGMDAYKKKVEEHLGATYAEMLDSMGFSKLVTDGAEASYLSLHAEPLKLGESWEATSELNFPMVGKVTYTREYQLKAIEDKNGRHCAHITLTGDISAEQDKDAAIKYSYNDVDWTGDLWLDLETRETVDSTNTMKFTVDVEMGDYKSSSPSSVTTVLELIPEETSDTKDPNATSPEKKKPTDKEPGADGRK